jgi:hypothetical protein
MLVGLLLYDVFWVFGSPSAIGDNVSWFRLEPSASTYGTLWLHTDQARRPNGADVESHTTAAGDADSCHVGPVHRPDQVGCVVSVCI